MREGGSSARPTADRTARGDAGDAVRAVSDRTGDRAQLATSLVEAAVGALLILSVVAGFLWVPAGQAGTSAEATLDRTAADALAVLDAEAPVGAGRSRLSAACRSERAFAIESDALDERLDVVLPDSVFGRVETPHGTVGAPRPNGVPSGRAALPTGRCTVTIRVWYV
ncbi:DUF7262 family protein [Halobellus limi]|uniref:Uncharacterized protein n=1 Tax=Halobellus limi TaxID=699433 RepID=A0A1H5YJ89_9EURY|nr:hypothetical protein [Halobellus limi]SEG24171.1 hypothetical protein SAMN04488133_1619 [Halobellus limi]